MSGTGRWYFTKEQLENTPSRKCGMDAEKELSYRQQATNLIQDMGQRLKVGQLCINTAIVYMHRFYMLHSFTKFTRHSIATCALFLAAKVEEQPRKLEHVIIVSNLCLHRNQPQIDTKSEEYLKEAQELITNENILLQTLGFDIAVEHPHTSVVKFCDLVRASKDLAQTSYFMATNSLHLTTMCLQYRPTVVACVCIHVAYKWSSWEIPKSNEGKEWFFYIDNAVTLDLIEDLTCEFLAILEKCPSRLKLKQTSYNSPQPQETSPKDKKKTPVVKQESKAKPLSSKQPVSNESNLSNLSSSSSLPSNNHISYQQTPTSPSSLTSNIVKKPYKQQAPSNNGNVSNANARASSSASVPAAPVDLKKETMSYNAYKEKREKERTALQPPPPPTSEPTLPPPPPLISPRFTQPTPPPTASSVSSMSLNQPPSKESRLNFIRDNKDDRRTNLHPQSKDSRNVSLNDKQKTKNRIDINRHLHTQQQQQQMNHLFVEGSTINPAHSFVDNLEKSSTFNSSNSNFKINNNHIQETSNLNKKNWEQRPQEITEPFDIKKEIASDLKMEFSDNDSNLSSNDNFNLTSLPMLLTSDSSNINENKSKSSNRSSSFMSIFSSDKIQSQTNSNNTSLISGLNNELGNSNNFITRNLSSTKSSGEKLSSFNDEKLNYINPLPILSPLPSENCSSVKNEQLSPVSQIITQPFIKSAETDAFKIKQETILSSSSILTNQPYSTTPIVSPKSIKIKNEFKDSIVPEKVPEVIDTNILGSGYTDSLDSQDTLDNLKSSKHSSKDSRHHHHHHKKHDKHKRKHKKEKDKDRDREREKHRNRERSSSHEQVNYEQQSALRLTLPVPKEEPKSPIKLKISKRKLVDDSYENQDQGSLRFVIAKDRLSSSSVASASISNESAAKKRKSSPRNSSREKSEKRNSNGNADMNDNTHNKKIKDHVNDRRKSSQINSNYTTSTLENNEQQLINQYQTQLEQYQVAIKQPLQTQPPPLNMYTQQPNTGMGQNQRKYK